MEALLIINSILVAVSLYFIKDFHGDFKKIAGKVEKLSQRTHKISTRLNNHVKEFKEKVK